MFGLFKEFWIFCGMFFNSYILFVLEIRLFGELFFFDSLGILVLRDSISL